MGHRDGLLVTQTYLTRLATTAPLPHAQRPPHGRLCSNAQTGQIKYHFTSPVIRLTISSSNNSLKKNRSFSIHARIGYQLVELFAASIRLQEHEQTSRYLVRLLGVNDNDRVGCELRHSGIASRTKTN